MVDKLLILLTAFISNLKAVTYIDWISIIGSCASLFGLYLTFKVFTTIDLFQKNNKYWNDVKKANTDEHKFKGSGVEMKVNTSATLPELFTTMDSHVTKLKKIQTSLNSSITKDRGASFMFETRALELPNTMAFIEFLLLQIEIKSLEALQKDPATLDPAINHRIEAKRKLLLEKSQKTIHVD